MNDVEDDIDPGNEFVTKISQEEYEEMEKKEIERMEKLGDSDWKNIRGPRPWEDNKEYEELVEKVKSKKKSEDK